MIIARIRFALYSLFVILVLAVVLGDADGVDDF